MQSLNLVPIIINSTYARCQGQNYMWSGLVLVQAPQRGNAFLQQNFYSFDQKYATSTKSKMCPQNQNFLLERFSKTIFKTTKQT